MKRDLIDDIWTVYVFTMIAAIIRTFVKNEYGIDC